MNALEKLLEGTSGRLVRSFLSLAMGLLVAHFKQNHWYIAAGPLLQTGSKALRDKFPDAFEWLPF